MIMLLKYYLQTGEMILDFNQQVTFAIDAPTSKYDGQSYSYEEYKQALTDPI